MPSMKEVVEAECSQQIDREVIAQMLGNVSLEN